MSLIRKIKTFRPRHSNGRRVLLLCGFGGSIWQVKRMVRALVAAGYNVTVIDFPLDVLRKGDPALLSRLTDEVVALAESEAAAAKAVPLLVGVSLGALFVLNIVRRSERYNSGVLITGGDIVKIARKIFPRTWRLPYESHATLWRELNMYTEPAHLKGKRLLFVLPKKDHLVDESSLQREIATQQAAGNQLLIVERPHGHFVTIVAETVLFPKRVLGYLAKVN